MNFRKSSTYALDMLRPLALMLLTALPALAQPAEPPPVVVRVATFNVEDVRTDDLRDPTHTRLRRLAEVIQRLRPNVILLNEIAYDGDNAPGHKDGEPVGQNGQRFADHFLAVAQATDTRPMKMRAFMAPVNTGQPSGFDLDKNGRVVNTFPPLPPEGPDGVPPEPDEAGRAYGGDCWGFGTYPGQYGMALLVDERLTILADHARTFRLLPWDYMDGNFMPTKPVTEPANSVSPGSSFSATPRSWYTDEEKAIFRLSSKSHWDVPVQLPGVAGKPGRIVHFLCSHPTPPVFDGTEGRNRRRNHDEIRFWRDYIDNKPYLVDDEGREGGLGLEPASEAWPAHYKSFVILGDLNADPKKGDSYRDPIGLNLASCERVDMRFVPRASVDVPGLEPTDTASFKLRVDYVLPSRDLAVKGGGVWRQVPAGTEKFPSDHFPVWLEIAVPSVVK